MATPSLTFLCKASQDTKHRSLCVSDYSPREIFCQTPAPRHYACRRCHSCALVPHPADSIATAQRVETIISEAHEQKIPMFMSVVNVAEVWYIIARRRSQSDADIGIHSLRQLGIHFIDVHWGLAQEAGRFKIKNRMSFADCFAAALAKDKAATLVTGDKEFKQVEREITIDWLKNK